MWTLSWCLRPVRGRRRTRDTEAPEAAVPERRATTRVRADRPEQAALPSHGGCAWPAASLPSAEEEEEEEEEEQDDDDDEAAAAAPACAASGSDSVAGPSAGLTHPTLIRKSAGCGCATLDSSVQARSRAEASTPSEAAAMGTRSRAAGGASAESSASRVVSLASGLQRSGSSEHAPPAVVASAAGTERGSRLIVAPRLP